MEGFGDIISLGTWCYIPDFSMMKLLLQLSLICQFSCSSCVKRSTAVDINRKLMVCCWYCINRISVRKLKLPFSPGEKPIVNHSISVIVSDSKSLWCALLAFYLHCDTVYLFPVLSIITLNQIGR